MRILNVRKEQSLKVKKMGFFTLVVLCACNVVMFLNGDMNGGDSAG